MFNVHALFVKKVTEINFFTHISEIMFEEINDMKTLLKLIFISGFLFSCSGDDTEVKPHKFKVVSATSKTPITNCVLEIKEALVPNSKVIETLTCNEFGEFVIPEGHRSKYGNLKATGYKTLQSISLRAIPVNNQYELDPYYWTVVHLKLGIDSIASFHFAPWGNWDKVEAPGVDTVFPPIQFETKLGKHVAYMYSLKSNPSNNYFKKIPLQVEDCDTIHVFIEY